MRSNCIVCSSLFFAQIVIGALYGTQHGREISIHTTYELLCAKTSEGKHTIGAEYYMDKAEQSKWN
jgi:hypothetical protein